MCPSLELFNIISKLKHTWKLGDGNAKLATPSNQLVVIIIILRHCHHKLSTLATFTFFYQAFFVQKIFIWVDVMVLEIRFFFSVPD
jgi:hypothetical protein